MVVHYTNAILFHMPFIGAWGLPPPVKRCIPALVMYLYPAMFGIAQGKGRQHQAACRRWRHFYSQACLLSWKQRQHLSPCRTPTANSAPSEGVQRAVLTKQQCVSQGQTRGPLQPKSMFERIVLLRLARRAAARCRRVPMDQSRGCGVAHTAAVVEQEIVKVVRAAAVDPRDRTAHHNQARPLELNSKGKLTSLIIFKGLQSKKNAM